MTHRTDSISSLSLQSDTEGWNLVVAAVAVAAIAVLVVPGFTRAWGLNRKRPRWEEWYCGIAVTRPALHSYMLLSWCLLVASLCSVGRQSASSGGKSNKLVQFNKVVRKESSCRSSMCSRSVGWFIDQVFRHPPSWSKSRLILNWFLPEETDRLNPSVVEEILYFNRSRNTSV